MFNDKKYRKRCIAFVLNLQSPNVELISLYKLLVRQQEQHQYARWYLSYVSGL